MAEVSIMQETDNQKVVVSVSCSEAFAIFCNTLAWDYINLKMN